MLRTVQASRLVTDLKIYFLGILLRGSWPRGLCPLKIQLTDIHRSERNGTDVSSSGYGGNEACIHTSILQAGCYSLFNCADNPVGECCHGNDPRFTCVPTEWSHSLKVHLRGRRYLATTQVGGCPQRLEKSRPDCR